MDRSCGSCGKQLQADQGFCDACGTAWASPVPAASGNDPTRTRSSNKSLLLAIIAVAVLAAPGAGGWFVARAHTTAPVVATSSGPVATPSAAVAPSSTPPLAPLTADGSDAAAATRPCSFVTKDQMERILGGKVVRITADETTCSYYTDITNPDLVATLEFTWTGGKTELNQRKGFEGANFEKISDLGDEAYMQAAGVLHTLKGDTYLQINSRTLPNHDDVELAIARKVMETLK